MVSPCYPWSLEKKIVLRRPRVFTKFLRTTHFCEKISRFGDFSVCLLVNDRKRVFYMFFSRGFFKKYCSKSLLLGPVKIFLKKFDFDFLAPLLPTLVAILGIFRISVPPLGFCGFPHASYDFFERS